MPPLGLSLLLQCVVSCISYEEASPQMHTASSCQALKTRQSTTAEAIGATRVDQQAIEETQ